MVACRQHVGWYPAWKSAWNKVLKYSGILLYAFLMHSNPMQSGPGALVEEEDFMAFWISSLVTFGYGSWWLVESVGSLIWDTGGAGKRA
jgi:hypothetical protein